jgi:hypothetical protein
VTPASCALPLSFDDASLEPVLLASEPSALLAPLSYLRQTLVSL